MGGWDTRDALADMPPQFAVTVDNFVIKDGYFETRRGFRKKVEINGFMQSAVPYNFGGNKKIFVAGNNQIYDCDFNNNAFTVVKDNVVFDEWQEFFYKGRLYFFNGIDNAQVYDGTAGGAGPAVFSDAQFTGDGLDISALISGAVYQNRIFAIERGTLNIWYSETAGQVSGNMLLLDLSQVARLGGELMAVCTWTYSAAAAQQESQIIFITSEGEALVYAGDDPNNIDAWALRGRYRIPKPLGRRCVETFGGDVAYISHDGYFLLSQLFMAPAAIKGAAFSTAINEAVKDQSAFFDNFGWQAKLAGAANMFIVNVPVAGGNFVQHVMNVASGAWSRFTGQNAAQFCELAGNLYFCGQGGLYQANINHDDDGKNIPWKLRLAFSNFGSPLVKTISEVHAYVGAYNNTIFDFVDSVDFGKERTANRASPAAPDTQWDLAVWDQSPWAGETALIKKRIIPQANPGHFFSLGISGSTSGQPIKFVNMDVFFKTGRNLI